MYHLTIKSKHFFQKKNFVKKKVGQNFFWAKQILIKQILVEKEIQVAENFDSVKKMLVKTIFVKRMLVSPVVGGWWWWGV